MKKVLVFMLIIALVISLGACANNDNDDEGNVGEENQQDNVEDENGTEDEDINLEDATFKDGTYEAEGDEWENGKENATVVIEDGEIYDVTLRRLDKEGNEVDYENWTGEEKNGKTYPNLKQFKEDMADRMIDQQTWDVDIISGATTTTENWRLSVKRALAKAVE